MDTRMSNSRTNNGSGPVRWSLHERLRQEAGRQASTAAPSDSRPVFVSRPPEWLNGRNSHLNGNGSGKTVFEKLRRFEREVLPEILETVKEVAVEVAVEIRSRLGGNSIGPGQAKEAGITTERPQEPLSREEGNASSLPPLRGRFEKLTGGALSIVRNTKEVVSRVVQNGALPAAGSRLLPAASGQSTALAEREAISPAEKRANRDTALAVLTVGASIVATTVWAPLTLLCAGYIAYTSLFVLKKAYSGLREGKITVDALSSIVIYGGLASGYLVVMSLANLTYCVSRSMLQKVKRESEQKLANVFSQHPQNVWIVDDEAEIEIPFEELRSGDVTVVSAGGIIPADGTIIAGAATIDQRILTGEAQPAEKGPGDAVFASTIVLSGRVLVSVESAGNETIVARIGQILNQTAGFKSEMQLRSEEITDKTIVPTLLLSGASLPFIGPQGALGVLNAHYKYKLGIVAPISILSYLELMSERQILIKDGRTLDLLNRVDTLVFDKTGTLTEEEPEVEAIHQCSGYSEDEILAFAAASESRQNHPIARAILQAATRAGLSLEAIDEASYHVGYGLAAQIGERHVRVGSMRFMTLEGIAVPRRIEAIWESCRELGHSLVMVAIDNTLAGAIELRPTVRPEAGAMIAWLREHHGISHTCIISGDHEIPTRRLAEQLGIDHFFAETLPEQKASIIKDLQAQGRFVCFVGDGINDAIALKQAQVSISLRGASTVATDTAQIILMDGRLTKLPSLFQLADEYDSNMKVGFATVIVPALIGMTGAIFFNFTLLHTILLGYGGLTVGILNGMWPGIKHHREKVAEPRIPEHQAAQIQSAQILEGQERELGWHEKSDGAQVVTALSMAAGESQQ